MGNSTQGTPTVKTNLTGNPVIDSLLDGNHWASSFLTYSFVQAGSYYATSYPDTTLFKNVQGFNSTQQAAAISAMQAWANVANLTFSQVADDINTVGTLRFAFSPSHAWGNSSATTYLPNVSPAGGDMFFDPNSYDTVGYFGTSSFLPGSYVYNTVLHELGHALGLQHPFSSSTNGGGKTVDGTAYAGWDSRYVTIMAYAADYSHPSAIGFTFNPTTPMLADIGAIQAIYGANTSFNSGNTTYSFNDNVGQYYFQTIWDGGGYNTISYKGLKSSYIDMNQGHGSYVGNPVYESTANVVQAYQVNNLWIAYGVDIHSVDVSQAIGNINIIGNDLGNRILCGTGYNEIVCGKGNDYLVSTTGTHLITGGAGVDTVQYPKSFASYQVKSSSGSYTVSGLGTFDSLVTIERVVFPDKNVAFDLDASNSAGGIYRLYAATFNRVPDQAGLGYWISKADGGESASAMAQDFTYSAEFQSAYKVQIKDDYGTGANVGNLVNSFYQNVLHRAPDPGGLTYYSNQITSRGKTIGQVLSEIADSSENHVQIAGQIQNGVEYVPWYG